MKPIVHFCAAIVLAIPATTCWGFLGGDSEPMYVEADAVDIDDAKGEAVYTGSVDVKQGGMHIAGERMTTHQNDKSEVDKIVTTGGPATLKQAATKTKKALDAKASRIEMYLSRNMVYFIGNASIIQTNTEFYGERIEYNLDTQAIHADRGNSKGKRVRMVLHPTKKKAAQ